MLIQGVSLSGNSGNYQTTTFGDKKSKAAGAAVAKVKGTVHEISDADFRRAFPGSKVPSSKDCKKEESYGTKKAREITQGT